MTIHRKEKHGKRLQSKTPLINELRYILNLFHRFKTSFDITGSLFYSLEGRRSQTCIGKRKQER